MSPSEAPSGPDPEQMRPRHLLRPAVLMLLREQESHGYELMRRLAEVGDDIPPTTHGLYRMLRTMETDGLVASYWSTPGRGPARRVYAITDAGEARLEFYMVALARLLQTVKTMLNRSHRALGG